MFAKIKVLKEIKRGELIVKISRAIFKGVYLSVATLVFVLAFSSNTYADPINDTDFVMTIDTRLGGNPASTDFVIPTDGSGINYNVQCEAGGAIVTGQTGDYTCNYGTPGVYKIRLSGTLPQLNFSQSSGNRSKLVSIDQWGTIAWQSFSHAFDGASNMNVLATDVPDLTHVTDMSYMFNSAKNITGVASFNNWNVSHVTNMNSLFAGAEKFNQSISNWDVSNVTDMTKMFYKAKEFDQPINTWHTDSLNTVTAMFLGAEKFNQPVDNLNFSNVTSMSNMFSGAKAFNQSLDGLDTSHVTNMRSMLSGATAFDQSLGALKIESVTDMGGMLNNSGLSRENYENTLIAWKNKEANLQSNANLGATGLKYCLAKDERQSLITNKSWTISGDSYNCSDFQPTDLSLFSLFTLYENMPIGTNLGGMIVAAPYTLTADKYSFSFCGGPNDEYFSLHGSMLALAKSPDYEQTPTLTTCIKVTTPFNQTFSKTLTINVVNYLSLSYDDNGSTSGAKPPEQETYMNGDLATVANNVGALAKTGYVFAGWNTMADGSGTDYSAGDTLTLTGDVKLYAKWTAISTPPTPSTPSTPPAPITPLTPSSTKKEEAKGQNEQRNKLSQTGDDMITYLAIVMMLTGGSILALVKKRAL